MSASDVVRVVEELLDADPDYEKAEDYYEGDVPEVFASDILARLLEHTGTDYPFNFARVPVNAVLDRLKITDVSSPADEAVSPDRAERAAAAGEPTTTLQLEAIWRHNELALEQIEVHRWTLVYGESYVLVWPSDMPGEVDIVYESPRQMRLIYDEERPLRKRYAGKVWMVDGPDGEELRRVTLYYPDRLEKWIQKPGTKGDQPGDYEPYIDQYRPAEPGEMIEPRYAYGDDSDVPAVLDGFNLVAARGGEPVPDWPIRNPYGAVPVFHFRTCRPHGRPEHKDAYGPQNAINKIIISQMGNVDFTTFPQRYEIAGHSIGGEPQDFPQDGDGVGVGDDDDEVTTFTASPAGLWRFPEGTKVGQFEPGDVDQYLKPLAVYIRAMASLTETPIQKFEGFSGMPSGETLKGLNDPLNRKANRHRDSFGSTWVHALQFALLVLNLDELAEDAGGHSHPDVDGDGDVDALDHQALINRAFRGGRVPEVTVSWSPIESNDDKDTAQRIQFLRAARVLSRFTAVRIAHPEWDVAAVLEELERLDEEEQSLQAPEDLSLDLPPDEPPPPEEDDDDAADDEQ